MFDFSHALRYMKESPGGQIARRGWNGKGMWIAIQHPTKHSKMTRPYIYMKTADDQLVPWLASQSDLLADDWEIVHVE